MRCFWWILATGGACLGRGCLVCQLTSLDIFVLVFFCLCFTLNVCFSFLIFVCYPPFASTFQLTKHCDYRSRHHSVDDLTVIGSAALVAPATAGSINSARTISAHLLTYGEQPSSVVTLERRYGPRRLRDDDDDDDDITRMVDYRTDYFTCIVD